MRGFPRSLFGLSPRWGGDQLFGGTFLSLPSTQPPGRNARSQDWGGDGRFCPLSFVRTFIVHLVLGGLVGMLIKNGLRKIVLLILSTPQGAGRRGGGGEVEEDEPG